MSEKIEINCGGTPKINERIEIFSDNLDFSFIRKKFVSEEAENFSESKKEKKKNKDGKKNGKGICIRLKSGKDVISLTNYISGGFYYV